MPANRRRIEENVRAEERRDARGLGEPLIPADQHADVRVARLPHAKPVRLRRRAHGGVRVRITGREVVLLVKERVVGDVHLAIHAEQRPIGVDDRRGVSIDAARLLLEQRNDENDRQLLRQRLHSLGRRAGNRLGDVESVGAFRLAEVGRVEELFEADDLRAARRGFADTLDRRRDVLRHVACGAVLNDSNCERRVHARKLTTRARADSRPPRTPERQRTITPTTTSFTLVPVSRRGMSALAARSALYDSCAASA